MNWAQRRRFMIIGGAAALFIVLASAVVFSVVYEAPSCMDRKQNQDEEGIDCGGVCTYLCTASVDAPRVSFVRALPSGGRTDVLAYIENRNLLAETKNAMYTVELFDANGLQLAKREGMIDLPARSVVPVFIPSVYAGTLPVARAFVTFDDSLRWTRATGERTVPTVSDAVFTGGAQPRVTATLGNPSAVAMYGVKVVATVFDVNDTAIAASQTVVREILPQGSTQAVFTWNEPFGESLRVEVLPVLSLP